MAYDQKTIEALAALRTYAAKYPRMGLSDAVNTLDNAGVFAALDEQTDYTSAEDILAESAQRTATAARRAGFETVEIQDEIVVRHPGLEMGTDPKGYGPRDGSGMAYEDPEETENSERADIRPASWLQLATEHYRVDV